MHAEYAVSEKAATHKFIVSSWLSNIQLTCIEPGFRTTWFRSCSATRASNLARWMMNRHQVLSSLLSACIARTKCAATTCTTPIKDAQHPLGMHYITPHLRHSTHINCQGHVTMTLKRSHLFVCHLSCLPTIPPPLPERLVK